MKMNLNLCLLVLCAFVLVSCQEKMDLEHTLKEDCSHLIIHLSQRNNGYKDSYSNDYNCVTFYMITNENTQAKVFKLLVDNQEKLYKEMTTSRLHTLTIIHAYDKKKSRILAFYPDESMTEELLEILEKTGTQPVGDLLMSDLNSGLVPGIGPSDGRSVMAIRSGQYVVKAFKISEEELLKILQLRDKYLKKPRR